MSNSLHATPLFPTRIAQTSLRNDALCEDIKSVCNLLSEEDTAGLEWSAREGYPGYTSYASLEDLCGRFSIFGDLRALLDPMAEQFAKLSHWDLSGKTLQLDHIWANILLPGGMHSGHIHPGSIISGTYYVDVPDGSGRLKFEDPRLSQMMAAPPLNETAPINDARFFYVEPKAGDVVLWESWLRHEVTENISDDPRLSISFNYAAA